MAQQLEKALEAVVGKTCRIETTDGSVRNETIYSVKSRQIVTSEGEVAYPVTLYFDANEIDGVDLHILKSLIVQS